AGVAGAADAAARLAPGAVAQAREDLLDRAEAAVRAVLDPYLAQLEDLPVQPGTALRLRATELKEHARVSRPTSIRPHPTPPSLPNGPTPSSSPWTEPETWSTPIWPTARAATSTPWRHASNAAATAPSSPWWAGPDLASPPCSTRSPGCGSPTSARCGPPPRSRLPASGERRPTNCSTSSRSAPSGAYSASRC